MNGKLIFPKMTHNRAILSRIVVVVAALTLLSVSVIGPASASDVQAVALIDPASDVQAAALAVFGFPCEINLNGNWKTIRVAKHFTTDAQLLNDMNTIGKLQHSSGPGAMDLSQSYNRGPRTYGVCQSKKVYTAAAGTVVYVATDPHNATQWGYYVKVQHNFNGQILYSIYAHLKRQSPIKKGPIAAGIEIGEMGCTGNTGGCSDGIVHFEVRRPGTRINDWKFALSGSPTPDQGNCGDASGVGVYLYSDINFQGRCTKLSADSPYPFDWYVGNDAASSVRMVGIFSATLCFDANYGSPCSTFYGSDPDLRNDAVGNDTTSSVRLQTVNSQPTPTTAPTRTPVVTNTPTSTQAPTNTTMPTTTGTATLTATNTPVATNTPTVAPTSTPVVNDTPTPTLTATPTAMPTSTQVATATSTPTLTATPTAMPTGTAVAADTPTVPPTPTSTNTATSTPTNTPVPTLTPTSTAVPDSLVYPRGDGYTFGGSTWANIASQNTVYCSSAADKTRVLYYRTTSPDGWIRWTPTIYVSGYYDLYIYLPDYGHTAPITTRARYQVNTAAGGMIGTVTLDQNLNKCSWVSIGRYYLSAGTGNYVYMPVTTSESPFHVVSGDGLKAVWVAP